MRWAGPNTWVCCAAALERKLENGKVVVYPSRLQFLKHRNALKVGKGNIAADIELAREKRLEKYR